MLQKKLDLYEKFVKDLKELEHEENKHKTYLEDSILIENHKVKSDLSESFLVIDYGKNLEELSKSESCAIHEQNNLHNYNKAKNYVEKTSNVFSAIKYVVSISKWLLFI